jgi:hypothetical protein
MNAASWFYSQSFNGRIEPKVVKAEFSPVDPIAQAARIIRDKMTGIGDQDTWAILKNAHEYLWKQIDFTR